MAAVGGDFFLVCALPLQPQELFGNAHINDIPGQDLLFPEATGGIEILIDAALAESIVPLGIVEILVPAVQTGTVQGGLLNDRTETAVTAGKDSFQSAQVGAVIIIFNGLE